MDSSKVEIFKDLTNGDLYGNHGGCWYKRIDTKKWNPVVSVPAGPIKLLNTVVWGLLYEEFLDYIQ